MLVCDWLDSVEQNNFYVMLFFRDTVIFRVYTFVMCI